MKVNNPKSKPNRNPDALAILGQTILNHRKKLGVGSQTLSEFACISRVTLHRIERGEPSVNIGAYMQVCKALGLGLFALEKPSPLGVNLPDDLLFDANDPDGEQIPIQQYPQLKELAWQLKKDAVVSPKDALNIYERNWRFIDIENMSLQEKALIEQLKNQIGGGCLLV